MKTTFNKKELQAAYSGICVMIHNADNSLNKKRISAKNRAALEQRIVELRAIRDKFQIAALDAPI